MAGTYEGQADLPAYFTTHWSTANGGYYNEGNGQDGDNAYLKYEKDGKPWDISIKPAYNNYHCMITSPVEVKVSSAYPDQICYKFSVDGITRIDSSNGVPDVLDIADSTVNAFVRSRSMISNNGNIVIKNMHVDFINFGQQLTSIYGLKENDTNVQVLINARPGSEGLRFNSLYTIIFPPFWKKSDKLPMKVIGGGYGTTPAMTMAYDPVLLCDVAESKLFGAPYIIIFTNHGGHESLGINSSMMTEIANFLSSFMPELGGDPRRVGFEGSSRGGTVALSWGANVGSSPYQTRMIKSRVPVTKLGDMLGYSLSVFPDLGPAIKLMLGSENAWKFDYCGLNSEQKAGYIRQLFTGFQDRDSANAHSTYGFLEKADISRFDSTCIMMFQGTHDGFMPMPGFLQLDSMMTRRGILHAAQYGFGFGHDFLGNATACNRAFDSICRNRPVTRANGREYYVCNYVNDNIALFSQQLLDTMKVRRIASVQTITDMPFSVTIPYRVLVNDSIFILLMGKNGCSWRLSAREESGYTNQIYASGIFGVPFVSSGPGNSIKNHRSGFEFQIIKVFVPSTSSGKCYEWFFGYNDCEIPNRFTPKKFALRQNNTLIFRKTITEFIGAEQSYNDYRLNDYQGKAVSSYNFGIDQLHPLLFTDNTQPVLDSIADLEINAGDTARFTVSGHDPDLMDTLVYDVRFADSDSMLYGATFNGKTGGLFSWPSTEADSGMTYNIVARASDGKGGKAERRFSIRCMVDTLTSECIPLPPGYLKKLVVLTDGKGSVYLPLTDTQYIEKNGVLNPGKIFPGARVSAGNKEYVWTTIKNDSATWFDGSAADNFASYCFLPVISDFETKMALELLFQLQVKIWVKDSLLKVIVGGDMSTERYSPLIMLSKGTTDLFLRLGALTGGNGLRARFVNQNKEDITTLKTTSLVEHDSTVIHVISPDNGGTFKAGDTITVRWSAVMHRVDGVIIKLSKDGGTTWERLTTRTILPSDSSWGVYKWTVPDSLKDKSLRSKNCLIQVSCDNLPYYDNSDQVFTLGDIATSMDKKVKQRELLEVYEDNQKIIINFAEKNSGSVEIFSLNGVVVYRSNDCSNGIKIDKMSISGGVYYMRIASQSVKLNRKLFVF